MLTIVMPVYNERATLRTALNRLLAVEMPAPTEVLVVDDGSTDGCIATISDLIFVSHNLDFARRLSTKVWDVHDGIVEVYPGSLGEYLDHLAALEAADDGEPDGAKPGAPVGGDKEARKDARQKAKQAESERRKQKKDLEKRVSKAEETIAKLEAEHAALEAALADPTTHADPTKSREKAVRFDVVRRELEAAMAEWEKAGEALAACGDAT